VLGVDQVIENGFQSAMPMRQRLSAVNIFEKLGKCGRTEDPGISTLGSEQYVDNYFCNHETLESHPLSIANNSCIHQVIV
jgi:hypothetical protein